MKQYFYNWYYSDGFIQLHRGIKTDPNVKTIWHYGLFDINGNMILDIAYDSTTIWENYIVFRKKEFSGVTDKKGNILLEPIYKRINSSKYGIIAWVDGIIKFFNQKGQLQFKLSDEGQTVFWDNDFFIKIKWEQGNESSYTILNLNGQIVLDNIHFCTFHNSHIQYKPEEFGHNYGLVDKFGNEIAKPIYKYIHPIGENYILTQENKAYLINKNGVCLLECTKIENRSDSMLFIEKNGAKYLTDINGNVLLEEAIESCYKLAHNGPKPEDGLYGKIFEEYSNYVEVKLLNRQEGIFKNDGTYVLNPVFFSLDFTRSEGKRGLGKATFLIKRKGLFKKPKDEDYQHGFINGNGTILMESGFDYSVLYNNPMIPSMNLEDKKTSRWFISKNNKKENISANHYTIEGTEFYFAQDGNAFCMYSKNGERLSNLLFDNLFLLNEKLFIVTADKKMGLVDRSGRMVTSVEFDYFYTPENGIIRFIKNGSHGVMSENGTVIVDPVYSMIYQYVDGIARTSSGLKISKRIEGRWTEEDYGKDGLIDLQGRIILKPICDRISFIQNVFLYQINNKFGIMNNRGALILEPLYDSVEVKDKIFIIEKSNMFGVADRSGRIIAEPKYEKSRGDWGGCFKIDTPDERKLVLHNGQIIDINEVLGEYIINNNIRKELHPVHQDVRTLKNNNEFETDKVKDAVVKILSFLTGSSKETLLNVKSDIKQFFVNQPVSNYQEKKHVFQRLINDMPNILNIDEIKSLPMYEILAQMIEIYEVSNEEEFLQMINRVLVHFYQLEFEKNDKFIEAFLKFSADFEKFAKDLIEPPYTLKYMNKEELVKDMAETFLIVASDKYGEKNSLYNMKQMTKLDLLSFFHESIKDEEREKVEELMKWVKKFYGHESSNLEAFMLDIEGYLYTSV